MGIGFLARFRGCDCAFGAAEHDGTQKHGDQFFEQNGTSFVFSYCIGDPAEDQPERRFFDQQGTSRFTSQGNAFNESVRSSGRRRFRPEVPERRRHVR